MFSRGIVVDDQVNGEKVVREVFCPIDYDTVYVSEATSPLGILSLRWLAKNYCPDVCRVASLEQHNAYYELTHAEEK